jgi:GTPase involved in cell partitioning and DNA repair
MSEAAAKAEVARANQNVQLAQSGMKLLQEFAKTVQSMDKSSGGKGGSGGQQQRQQPQQAPQTVAATPPATFTLATGTLANVKPGATPAAPTPPPVR